MSVLDSAVAAWLGVKVLGELVPLLGFAHGLAKPVSSAEALLATSPLRQLMLPDSTSGEITLASLRGLDLSSSPFQYFAFAAWLGCIASIVVVALRALLSGKPGYKLAALDYVLGYQVATGFGSHVFPPVVPPPASLPNPHTAVAGLGAAIRLATLVWPTGTAGKASRVPPPSRIARLIVLQNLVQVLSILGCAAALRAQITSTRDVVSLAPEDRQDTVEEAMRFAGLVSVLELEGWDMRLVSVHSMTVAITGAMCGLVVASVVAAAGYSREYLREALEATVLFHLALACALVLTASGGPGNSHSVFAGVGVVGFCRCWRGGASTRVELRTWACKLTAHGPSLTVVVPNMYLSLSLSLSLSHTHTHTYTRGQTTPTAIMAAAGSNSIPRPDSRRLMRVH